VRVRLTDSVSFGLSTAAARGTLSRNAVWILMLLASFSPPFVVFALIDPEKETDIEVAEDRQQLITAEE
jgi:hypothetical protein